MVGVRKGKFGKRNQEESRAIFCLGKQGRSRRECVMLKIRDGMELSLGGCWWRCLDQPKVGKGEAAATAGSDPVALLRGEAAAPPAERAGRESELRMGTRTARNRTGCPGHTRTRRACRQWVLGSGEEERRISAPNSICWRTWPAPRQAENSTHVRTCTQCWLCPLRALPSCCAPPAPPAPRSPPSPPRGQNAP